MNIPNTIRGSRKTTHIRKISQNIITSTNLKRISIAIAQNKTYYVKIKVHKILIKLVERTKQYL